MSTTNHTKVGTKNAEQVVILDGSGDQITSFGGGTQYTEGDTDTSITGNALLMEGAGNTLVPAQGTVADGLLVNLGSNNDVTVASLPLPSGAATEAKQDTGNTSLASIDTKTPVLGQALAAASVPVVLTAAQVTTLTPPAAITGFATESTLSTLNGKVTAVNTGAVVVSSSALPSGAATSAKQDDIITAIGAIPGGGGTQYTDGDADASPTGTAVVFDDGGTMTVVSDTAPLPVLASIDTTGLATSAKQDTGNTSLASIDGKITAVNTGAVVISSSALPALAATSTKQSDGSQKTQVVDGSGNVIGATSNALDINIKSGNISGFATSAKQDTIIGHVDGIETLLTAIDGHVDGIEGSVDGLETSNSAIQTAVELIDDTVATLGTTTYTETTTKGLTIGAVRRDADTTLVNTTNEIGPLQMDANGRLKVEAFSGETLPVSFTGSGDVATQTTLASLLTSSQLIDDGVYTDDTSTHSTGSSKGYGIMAAATPTDTAVNANDIGMVGMTNNRELYASIRDIAGATAQSGSGTATGALRVELANNGTGTLSTVTTVSTVSALGISTTGPQKAEDVASAGGDMGIAIMAARLDTPVANASVSNDGDYTTPVLDNYRKLWITGTVPEDTAHVAGEAIMMGGARRIDPCANSAGSDADWGTVNQSAEGALWVATAPTTASGCTIFRSLDIDETEEDIKTSAGNIYAIYFGNATSSIRYLKFYNATAANTTVGSTTPVLTFLIPASAAGWLALPFPATFGTAICVACTTGVADADTGAPGTNDVIINVLYK